MKKILKDLMWVFSHSWKSSRIELLLAVIIWIILFLILFYTAEFTNEFVYIIFLIYILYFVAVEHRRLNDIGFKNIWITPFVIIAVTANTNLFDIPLVDNIALIIIFFYICFLLIKNWNNINQKND